jgi:hypothetical protein
MNIFVLDNNPVKAAQYHCNKHLSKMIVESAQLLSTNLRIVYDIDTDYKSTHSNHPCRLWLAESPANMQWLIDMSLELCNMYTKKSSKVHKTEHVLNNIRNIVSTHLQPNDCSMTDFALAMPNECKLFDNAVDCYRYYYATEKLRIVQKYGWPFEQPSWYTDTLYSKINMSDIYANNNIDLHDSNKLSKLIAKHNDTNIRKHLYYYSAKLGITIDNLIANYDSLNVANRKFLYVTQLDIDVFNFCQIVIFSKIKYEPEFIVDKRKKYINVLIDIADYTSLHDLYEHYKYKAWLHFTSNNVDLNLSNNTAILHELFSQCT